MFGNFFAVEVKIVFSVGVGYPQPFCRQRKAEGGPRGREGSV